LSGPSTPHRPDGIDRAGALARLAVSLQALSEIDDLEPVQRQVLRRRIDTLLDRRERLLVAFADTFGDDALDAYRATRSTGGVLTGQSLHDEALHFFALSRLSLVDGAETEGHLERTSGYVTALAEARGDDATFVASLGFAALIHDVGLVVVPEEVFVRRGQVDSYESLLIEIHTRVGTALVSRVMEQLGVDDGPLALGRDIVRCHHERFDGLGPHGLAGEVIPYAARLFAFADVYDTLRRRRPHREPLDHAAAVVAIRAGNRDGQAQFDPTLLPAFVACADRFDDVFRVSPDSD
jgi:response regulator RpfG family c-di-GMP phosphodiesterase